MAKLTKAERIARAEKGAATRKARAAAKKVDGLVGFARLKALDPERFKALSAKAGRKAQKLFGHKVRWSKTKARALASKGGKAAQRKYKKTGHPLTLRAAARQAAE